MAKPMAAVDDDDKGQGQGQGQGQGARIFNAFFKEKQRTKRLLSIEATSLSEATQRERTRL